MRLPISHALTCRVAERLPDTPLVLVDQRQRRGACVICVPLARLTNRERESPGGAHTDYALALLLESPHSCLSGM
jgi:hypothetical protein